MEIFVALLTAGLCLLSFYMMERPATVGEGLVSIKEEAE